MQLLATQKSYLIQIKMFYNEEVFYRKQIATLLQFNLLILILRNETMTTVFTV